MAVNAGLESSANCIFSVQACCPTKMRGDGC